jgi:hypothetical protein
MREIIINGIPDNVKRFMERENTLEKRIEYFTILPENFSTSSILIKDDGIIHYSLSMAKVQMSKESYYIRYYNKRGFTFDGKDLRIWFKGNIEQLIIADFLKAMKMEISYKYIPFITKTILKNILKGKIECTPIEILKSYFKTNRLPKECVAPYFLMMESKDAYQCPTKHTLLSARDHATSLYDFIVEYGDGYTSILRNAQVLNKKVDFSANKISLDLINKEFQRTISFHQPF